MVSHTHLSPRIRFPGEWFDQKQLPAAVCRSASSRRAAAGPQQAPQWPSAEQRCWWVPADTWTHIWHHKQLLLTGWQRHLVSTRATLMLPCGKLHLEYPNVPEVMKRGFEQLSAWLFAYESPTRRFGNLLMPHGTNTFWMTILHSYAVGVGCSTCTLPTVRMVCVFPYCQVFFLSSVKNARKCLALIIRLVGVFSTMGITVPAYPA